MTDADGEATETSIWLDFALSSDYIDNETHEKMINVYNEIGRMLNSMSDNPEKFIPRTSEH
jgi:four helix bundle protein